MKISVPKEDSRNQVTYYSYRSLDGNLVLQLTKEVQEAGGDVYHHICPPGPYGFKHGWSPPSDIIVALGSAGVFTAVYKAISSFLSRNRDRELTLERGEVKITIKGHSLPEEMDLLKKIAPELLPPIL